MAIVNRDQLISAIAAGRTVQFQKGSFNAIGAGQFITHFRAAGMPGSAGAAPATTGVALSRTSTGAMPIPAPSATSYISSFECVAGQAQTLILADRLVEFGGLSSIVITAQTVSALALPARATTATDVELWLEIYASGGATASASVTASYTNQASTAGRTATLVGGVPASGWGAGRTYQLALQAGDTGVKTVESLTIGTSSGTAGNVGLVLRRTLVFGPVPAANIAPAPQGWAETDLQICPDDACVELISLASTTSTGNIMGNFGICQG